MEILGMVYTPPFLKFAADMWSFARASVPYSMRNKPPFDILYPESSDELKHLLYYTHSPWFAAARMGAPILIPGYWYPAFNACKTSPDAPDYFEFCLLLDCPFCLATVHFKTARYYHEIPDFILQMSCPICGEECWPLLYPPEVIVESRAKTAALQAIADRIEDEHAL